MTHAGVIVRAALLAVLATVAWPQTAAQANKARAAKPARPNVLLITVDTLRADHVGCYGYQPIATATMDALARDGILFERAISQVPLTLPSHAAILTGTYPFQNGVQDFLGQPLAPSTRTIAQALQKNGYATGAVVSSYVLDRSWGLSRGFDFYYDSFKGTSFLENDPGLVERRAEESVNQALGWLRKPRRGPFFLWLHLYDPHSGYEPPEPFKSKYRERPYDGEIAYSDQQLGRLLQYLKQQRLYGSALIVLLSDHGESLGEHGENEHGFFLYDATVRVPLIVKPPAGRGFSPARVGRPVETIAVAPTILEITGVRDPVQKEFAAAGLLQPADGKDAAAAYSETFYPFSSFGWSPLRSLHTDRYHYIEAPEPELYELGNDPAEKANLAAKLPAVASVMKEKLEQRIQQHAPLPKSGEGTSRLSAEAAEKLRALGYVAYRSPVSAEALAAGLPDPKRKVEEFNAILQAVDASKLGDFERSKAILKQVRDKEPKLYLIPFLLGEAALKQAAWAEAAQELQKSLELNPDFDQAMTALARALQQQGQREAARSWVEKALTINPQNLKGWYQLGWMNLKDDPQAAVAAFQKALEIQPAFALARRDLGILLMQQQQYPEAAQHLEKAAELGLSDPRLFNLLGIAYSRTNRFRAAVKMYRRALQSDSNYAEAHLNLSYAYHKLNQTAAARAEYATACRLDKRLCSYVPGKQ